MAKKFLILIIFISVLIGLGVFFKAKKIEVNQHLEKASQKKELGFEGNLLSSTSSLKKESFKEPLISKEKIELITKDKVKIVGNFIKVKDSKKAVLLLHMMPSTKESFKEFSEILAENGFSSLAIDLRGHGESTQTLEGKKLDYRYFSDWEHQQSIYDLESASEFLENQGFLKENQYLVGASIGANLALEFGSLNPEIKKIILISPGLNYRGLSSQTFLKKITSSQELLFISSKKDFYAYESSKKLASDCLKLKISCKEIYLEGKSHGTDIFKENKEIYQKLILFLKAKN